MVHEWRARTRTPTFWVCRVTFKDPKMLLWSLTNRKGKITQRLVARALVTGTVQPAPPAE